MASNMMVHTGSRFISVEELATIEPPPATRTWNPIKHSRVLDDTCTMLNAAHFRIDRLSTAVARDNQRMFATIDLRSEILPGINLSVGIRSSTDKSLPLGFVAGNRVFVCDNLSFYGTINVTKKHTTYGMDNWRREIACSVVSLDSFVRAERHRIMTLSMIQVNDPLADHVIIAALRQGIIGSPAVLPIADQWRNPQHAEFQPRTGWSLFNAFTAALKPSQARDMHRFALATSQLYPLIQETIMN